MNRVLTLSTIVLIMGMLGYGAWWYARPPVDTAVAVEAPAAPAVKRVKKKFVPVKMVQVYAPEAKANLKLPPAVIAAADKHVISATTVQPSERRITVSSVIDTVTGETTVYSKPEPLPWVALESRGEVRFDVGYKVEARTLRPEPVGRLSVTHSVVQVKGLHFGVAASIDTTGEVFGGVGLSYRW